MSSGLDIEALGLRIASRFGIAVRAESETVDGGVFPVIRPTDIERGAGFCIVIARTHRLLEASFKADNFAAGLLRRMSEAEISARETFNFIVSETRKNGAQVHVGINGNSAEVLPDNVDAWRSFELDVSARLPSGKLTQDELLNLALSVTSSCLAITLALLPIEDEVGYDQQGLPEGARLRIEVNKYERSPANRAACIARYGPICQSCGFEFGKAYGILGEGYIEVHHKIPVSKMGEGYFVNPMMDLVPLCSNCHSMVHRQDPPIEIENLRDIVEVQRSTSSLAA